MPVLGHEEAAPGLSGCVGDLPLVPGPAIRGGALLSAAGAMCPRSTRDQPLAADR